MVLFIIASTSACTQKDNPSQDMAAQSVHEDPDGYWTCPMHPQVHQHEKGKCPICGMDLVNVDAKKNTETDSKNTTEINQDEIQVTDKQLQVAAIGRYVVSRKTLEVILPVAGSILLSNEIALQIDESDLPLIDVGSEFSGTLNSSPQEVLRGKIKRIDTMMDPTTRTLRVFGTLEQLPKKIVSDGGFQGKITARFDNQIIIPEKSVFHAGTRDLVYLISPDNKIRAKSVTLGNKSAEGYQILAGLSEGEVISAGPNFLLDSESKIGGVHDQAHH